MIDVYSPENDQFLEDIEEEYKYYNWEEKDAEENRVMYEYGLERLEELSKREKM